jgi:hypothetical protein
LGSATIQEAEDTGDRPEGEEELRNMTTALTDLERLSREIHKPEAEIMTMAFEAGLRQLWREHILGQYLRGEMSREAAIESVGIDLVDLAERQHAAMTEDLDWALKT